MHVLRIYVLEDDPERIVQLHDFFKGYGATVQFSQTCERAHEFTGQYDLILLDHDLGGRQMKDHEDCGATFLTLVKDALNPKVPVIIHSYNMDGAARMQALWPPAVRIPFGSVNFWAALNRFVKEPQ